MPNNQKVVFLGIDAGSRDLLQQWGHDQTLPIIHTLLPKCLTGFTNSLPGLFVGSTWASWCSGVNPGKHGRYSQQELRPGTYELYDPGLEGKREPFWHNLSLAGRKVAILDIPHTSLSQNLNGIQLVEYGAHDAHYGFLAWPPPLAEEVEKRFGPPSSHPIRGDCDAKRDAEGVAAFRDALIKGIARKTALTKHFLREGKWEFFAQVFTESHCIGHQCWHLHDPTHQWHDAEIANIVGDPIKDVYKAIDTAIGEILMDIDNETTVIILASHGMGPTNVPYNFLQKLLLHLNLTVSPSMNIKNTASVFTHKRILPTLSRTWDQLPATIRKSIKSVAPLRAAAYHVIDSIPHLPKVDREASHCFSIHDNPSHAGVRINLAGREPNGKVRPGAEFQQFCTNLEKDLLGIINVKTGKPIVNRIIRTADCYSGDYVDHLPDLLVEWNEEDPIPAVFSEKFGTIPTSFWHPRTGHHRLGGMFFSYGPSVTPGVLDRTVSIMDFAPTIAHLLNVSLPDVDGQPIDELLASRSSATLDPATPFP